MVTTETHTAERTKPDNSIKDTSTDMALYPKAIWNQAPTNCWTKRETKKVAFVIHVMDGYAGYLRNFDHLHEGRLISAHFTIDTEGKVQQHVDTKYIAYTQGVPPKRFKHVTWPRFKNRNPNIDVVSVELEDKVQAFSKHNNPTEEQTQALRELTEWLFHEGIVQGPPRLGVSIIGHFHLNPIDRANDPGKWWWQNIAPTIVPEPRKPVHISKERTGGMTIEPQTSEYKREIEKELDALRKKIANL